MKILTDDRDFSQDLLPQIRSWTESENSPADPISRLAMRIFESKRLYESAVDSEQLWQYLLIAKKSHKSQYDILIDLLRGGHNIPHGTLCLAGEGENFHGFKNRYWASPPGNIYLAAYFAPGKFIDHYGPGFIALAAVSVVEAIDRFPGFAGKAGIKWVNDVLMDSAKVCGVLAYTQAENDRVTGTVIGLGLNVETAPHIEPTPFVPKTSCLRDFTSDRDLCHQSFFLGRLLETLDSNYDFLINDGYKNLLDKYRNRSLVINRQVEICRDAAESSGQPEIIARGKVREIGPDLELYLEEGKSPITDGRLIMKN
jgi:biotin-[acetyl-CoA-carboxylase] ligase BirA-like protein